MKIIVKPHDIQISETDTVNEGEYNITQLNFQFSQEYTDDLVKKALFTDSKNKSYEILIIDNTCKIPSEVLLNQQPVLLGVYAYKITDSELVLRYSPSPVIFPVIDGSYRQNSVPSEEITPSQFEQYQQALQNGLTEVNAKLQEVINTSETLEKNGTYAKEQGDYAKETTDELVSKVENGDFNGATFTPSVDAEGNISWSNDKGLDNPQTQNIKGEKGDTGEPFTISKTYPSVEEMNVDFDNMNVGDYVMIASSVEDEDNAKLYVKTDTEWTFITDFSGAVGIKGEKGDIGPQGPQGVPGKDGVGITTITSGQSTVEEDKTVTPVTVNKTDGSSQTFNVESKNGLDGQNGQDGITPTIGENGNWYLGDTDTGKPSRGEVGPTPDLTDYVKNTDYPTNTTGGVVKNYINGFQVSGTGNPNTTVYSAEQYDTIGDYYFIGKGTLENAKDKIVGSSTPVQTLNTNLDNLVTKNTASGEIVSIDDALAYKTFDVKVDGSSEQETTIGKNLLPYPYPNSSKTNAGITFTVNDDGTVTVDGTSTAFTSFQIYGSSSIGGGVNIPGNYVSGGTDKVQVGVFRNNGDNTYSELANNKGGFTEIDKSSYTDGYVEIRINQGITVNNAIIRPMLSNEANIDWEPYTGGQPSPNPDYPQEITTLTFDKITRCGKNLYKLRDYEGTVTGMNLKIENQILSLDGTSNNTWFSIGNVSNQNNIPRLKKDEDYTVTFISTFNKDLNCTLWNDVGKVIIQGVQCNPVKDNSKSSFTFKCSYDEILTNFRIAFAGFTVGEEVQGTMQIMIEQGSQATDYEPYQGQTYDIDLQGNEMVEIPNGVKDELVIDKEGNVSLVKNVGKIVLDGSDDENWFVLNFAPRPLFDIRITDILSLSDPSIKNPTLCTNFISYSPNDIWMTNITGICVVQDSNTIRIGFKDNPYQTSEEFKNWLSTHNTTIYYQLEEPKTIPLGTLSELITTLNGTNNIFINGNIPTTISITYALDIKKYIDNKLAEIASAMIEEG